jgi:siroheme synthase-like protein
MKQAGGTTYYPVFLKIKGRKCVVIGGGEVALRKVMSLIEHGADVEVISPSLCPELDGMVKDGKIRSVTREYRSGDLKGAYMTVVATDNSAINRRVVAEARERHVLVNVVDDAENSDFIVPSCLRRGDLTVAVSTGGKSPALARKIRARLQKEMGEEYASLVSMVGEARAEMKRQGFETDGDGWQAALDLDLLLELIRRGKADKAGAVLRENLKKR